MVAAPPDRVGETEAVVRERRPGATVVAGGASRAESVAAGLAAVPAASEVVVVHDAARPLLTPEIVAAVVAGLDGADGAIAARPVADTLKRGDGGEPPAIAATVNRAPLWAAETPQAFWAPVLRAPWPGPGPRAAWRRPPTARRWSRRPAGGCASSPPRAPT